MHTEPKSMKPGASGEPRGSNHIWVYRVFFFALCKALRRNEKWNPAKEIPMRKSEKDNPCPNVIKTMSNRKSALAVLGCRREELKRKCS